MEWPAGEEVMMRGGGGSVPDMELTADRLLALAVGWLLVAGVECINMTCQELTERARVIPNSNVNFFLVCLAITYYYTRNKRNHHLYAMLAFS